MQFGCKARQHLKNMFMDTSLEWVLKDIEKTLNPVTSERLSEIPKKTLLIIGSEYCQPIKEIAKVLESAITMVQKAIEEGIGATRKQITTEKGSKNIIIGSSNEHVPLRYLRKIGTSSFVWLGCCFISIIAWALIKVDLRIKFRH